MIFIEQCNKISPFPIYIVRDDLLPFYGGGNKARKAIEYEKKFIEENYNAIVTTGGIQSNHNRAMAMLAAKHGWMCHLVYHGDKERFYSEKGNALLVRKTNASVEFVDSTNISSSMDRAMSNFREKGLKPFYVTGGGHDVMGGKAFVDSCDELKNKLIKLKWKPEEIYLATGTGSTQAGIVVGLESIGWGDVKVIGVSIAREKKRALEVTREFTKKLADYLNIKKDLTEKIHIVDDYLYGGYESYTSDMNEWLDNVMKLTGVFFDTTYSGKALWGMYNILEKRGINHKVLFWHTGGIMNLLK